VRDGGDGGGREEGSYYLLPSIIVELADVKPEVVSSPVPPNLTVVVLKGGDASGDELHPHHGSSDAGLPEILDSWAERLQSLLRKGLAGLGGELDGGALR
jgi:hypothetical protein